MDKRRTLRALAFIDLLGFSKMVNRNHDDAKSILNDFYDLTYRIIRDIPEIKGNLFSDSLLAHSKNPSLLINTICKIYRECLLKNQDYKNIGNFFLLPRGGISIGFVEIQRRKEPPNLTKNFIVSPALVHSSKIEELIKGSRLLVASKLNEEESIIEWNSQIKSVFYDNSTFIFWENYKYMDALWFLDLLKESREQKEEVIQLINQAIRLVLANADSKESVEHHIHTLRIGLLSYTKLLNPNSNNDIVTRIINDFRDDKYWLIWLTLIEMLMQSPDSWAFPNKREVVEFYKSKSWPGKTGQRHKWESCSKIGNREGSEIESWPDRFVKGKWRIRICCLTLQK
ncbi:MAG: hypothetical protein WA126_15460 [Thermodesulfovibrionales bacterium]